MTIPAGTVLPVSLDSAIGSDTSKVEDTVRGTLTRAIDVDGRDDRPVRRRRSSDR